MIALKFKCSYSGVKVSPANYKTSSSTKKDWRVYYRFYDEKHPDQWGRMFSFKGMNEYKDIYQRRAYVKALMDEIRFDLEERDYNPITGYRSPEVKQQYEVDPDTPILQALQRAYELHTGGPDTKIQLKSVLKYFSEAATDLNLQYTPIEHVKRRNILACLERLKSNKSKVWSNNLYNSYVAHLSMLFSVLVTWEALENNPCDKIPRLKTIKRQRETLTAEQRKTIDTQLRGENYRFWRFMHIFYHSGARETEILRVKKEDIDLQKGYVSYLIKKGVDYRIEKRPIKDMVLHLWEQVYIEAKPGQVVFSAGLTPGAKEIRREQITRRWRRWVKTKYGVTADFYSLKHSNSEELDAMYGSDVAAALNKHGVDVLRTHYATGHKGRVDDVLRGANNVFSTTPNSV